MEISLKPDFMNHGDDFDINYLKFRDNDGKEGKLAYPAITGAGEATEITGDFGEKTPIWYLCFNISAECDAKESIWICLTTGVLNCGRYVKAHALAHYEKTGHSVCMECRELSIFW